MPNADFSSGITLGILGGGQLGRMSAMAAARLGISVVIFCPQENSPASKVAARHIRADYTDADALQIFSDATDFITYEFENIPVKTIDMLVAMKKDGVFPSRKLLDVSQDRIKEKTFLNTNGIDTARWAQVKSVRDIHDFCKKNDVGQFIIKTARFGYDGKGQISGSIDDLNEGSAVVRFLEQRRDVDLILEEKIAFSAEASVIVSRDFEFTTKSYGPMLNKHKNHILDTTTYPAGLDDMVSISALGVAQKIADAVNLRGVLAVEFFVTEKGKLLVNEIAPRPHNSGHWTIDACAVSQFENHVRCVCGLRAEAARVHSDAVMRNLIGHDVDGIYRHFKDHDHDDETAHCVHLYGKKIVRDGRKMGHVTTLYTKGSL